MRTTTTLNITKTMIYLAIAANSAVVSCGSNISTNCIAVPLLLIFDRVDKSTMSTPTCQYKGGRIFDSA